MTTGPLTLPESAVDTPLQRYGQMCTCLGVYTGEMHVCLFQVSNPRFMSSPALDMFPSQCPYSGLALRSLSAELDPLGVCQQIHTYTVHTLPAPARAQIQVLILRTLPTSLQPHLGPWNSQVNSPQAQLSL